jgi:nitroreductase
VDIYQALYTTRAMRRVKPDPIPEPVQAKILDAAIRAPSGGNSQNWRFILVDSPEIKDKLGPLYRECAALLWAGPYAERIARARAEPDDPASVALLKVTKSAQYLAEHFEGVPLYLFAFTRNDRSGGSIFPAVWSAQLAARAEGVGSALTTILAFRTAETQQILGVPADRGWEMACCVSFGYPTGRWAIAPRRPAHEVAYRNTWGTDLGLEIPDPLWLPPEP